MKNLSVSRVLILKKLWNAVVRKKLPLLFRRYAIFYWEKEPWENSTSFDVKDKIL